MCFVNSVDSQHGWKHMRIYNKITKKHSALRVKQGNISLIIEWQLIMYLKCTFYIRRLKDCRRFVILAVNGNITYSWKENRYSKNKSDRISKHPIQKLIIMLFAFTFVISSKCYFNVNFMNIQIAV